MTIHLLVTDNHSGATYMLEITNAPLKAVNTMTQELASDNCEAQSIFTKN